MPLNLLKLRLSGIYSESGFFFMVEFQTSVMNINRFYKSIQFVKLGIH